MKHGNLETFIFALFITLATLSVINFILENINTENAAIKSLIALAIGFSAGCCILAFSSRGSE